jgi:hypothetical protein
MLLLVLSISALLLLMLLLRLDVLSFKYLLNLLQTFSFDLVSVAEEHNEIYSSSFPLNSSACMVFHCIKEKDKANARERMKAFFIKFPLK